MNLIDSMIEHMVAAAKHATSEAAPAAILWADPSGEWMPIIASLRER